MTSVEIEHKIREILSLGANANLNSTVQSLTGFPFVQFRKDLEAEFPPLRIKQTIEEFREMKTDVVKFVFNRLPKPDPADAATEEPIVNESLVAFSGNATRSFAPGRSDDAGAADQSTIAAEADSESTGGTTLKEFLKKHNLDQFLGVYTFRYSFLVLRLESNGKGLFVTWISKEAHLIGELFEVERMREPNENRPDNIKIASGKLIDDNDTAVTYHLIANFTKTEGVQLEILPQPEIAKHSSVKLLRMDKFLKNGKVVAGKLFLPSKQKKPIVLKLRDFTPRRSGTT